MSRRRKRNREGARPEIVSTAGSAEAGYAAFHYGADAVSADLRKPADSADAPSSAKATEGSVRRSSNGAKGDAEGFSLGELDELVGYAHSLEPKRRVYAQLDTLVLGRELASLIETLGSLADIGVDAVVVRDLGVCRAARRCFPGLRPHAGTHMAVHNRAGAETLARMGFGRVTAARELTLGELREIAAGRDIEIETFVHGPLCYSYSGLCLFSSYLLGRSAGRGRCARPCRRSFCEAGSDESHASKCTGGLPFSIPLSTPFSMPFSMKDLALSDHIAALGEAGVAGLRIEGGRASALYVAAVTDLYRRIIDGTLDACHRPALEADIKTISGRPWTELYIEGRGNPDVSDGGTTGHRGAPIGTVESIVFSVGEDAPYLRFRTSRGLELHDGLQIELPGLYRPFGFGVEKLRLVRKTRRAKRREVHKAPPGSLVEVALPGEYPQIPPGAPVYCTSSQEVKQRYRLARPRRGEFRSRVPLDVALRIAARTIIARASALPPATGERVEAEESLPGPFDEARDAGKTVAAARAAFGRLGRTRFSPGEVALDNPEGRFVPVSLLNELRRRVASALEERMASRLAAHVEHAGAELGAGNEPAAPAFPLPHPGFGWSVKVDRPGMLARFGPADLEDVEEVIVGIEVEPNETRVRKPGEKLEALASSVGRERVRLALPVITRGWEEGDLRGEIRALREAGWSKWEASNASAWSYLDVDVDPRDPAGGSGGVDLSADWPLYIMNRAAAQQLLDMGAARFTLSPEDGLENMRGLLAEFASAAVVIVYQDTPLFISETRVVTAEGARFVSGAAQEILVTSRGGRTVVVSARPFSIADRLDELERAGAVHLRADFSWREYSPEEVLRQWRMIHAGQGVPGSHVANFDRGLA